MIEHLFHTIAIVASTDSRLVLLVIKVSQLEIIVTHLKFVLQSSSSHNSKTVLLVNCYLANEVFSIIFFYFFSVQDSMSSLCTHSETARWRPCHFSLNSRVLSKEYGTCFRRLVVKKNKKNKTNKVKVI